MVLAKYKKSISLLCLMAFLTFSLSGCFSGSDKIGSVKSVKLGKIPKAGIVGGVCAGLAYKTGTSTTLWRVIFVVAGLFVGGGILIYVLLWIFLPEYEEIPKDFNKRTQSR